MMALLLLVFGLPVIANFYGRAKIRALMLAANKLPVADRASAPLGPEGHVVKQHSLTGYHGLWVSACVFLPAIMIVLVWLAVAPMVVHAMLEGWLAAAVPDVSSGEISILISKVEALHGGLIQPAMVSQTIIAAAAYYEMIAHNADKLLLAIVAGVCLIGFYFSQKLIQPRFTARQKVERIMNFLMLAASAIAIVTTIGIISSLLFETWQFFGKVSVTEFLFGLQWSPQIAIREGQAGGSGSFGAVPLFAGTLLITVLAMCLAVPIGLMSAIYLSEYARPRIRNIVKPAIEILAGIPTVVYGFFAALFMAPFLRNNGALIGLELSSESALAGGLVMGIMIIPFISSLSDDVINAVPQTLRDGSSALGATQSETVRQVVLPAALPGIVSAVLLAISRAIGETMIVVMAAGVAANLTANPFESVTTVTVQIVMLLVGDQEFDSAKTLAAFALGLVLFFITLALNIAALYIVRKYREQYD